MKVGVTFLLRQKLAPYKKAVEEAGLEAVPISPAQKRGLDGLRGLLLTGGGDVDPGIYGATERHALTAHVDRERDELEIALIEEAEAKDLPVLGICRGLQILNVRRKGTLQQHIDDHKDREHTIRTEPGSRIAVCVGEDDYTVNSRHHQATGQLGSNLLVTASAPDGTVEAIEDKSARFIMAVQWHPEDRLDTRDLRIFRAFAKEVCR